MMLDGVGLLQPLPSLLCHRGWHGGGSIPARHLTHYEVTKMPIGSRVKVPLHSAKLSGAVWVRLTPLHSATLSGAVRVRMKSKAVSRWACPCGMWWCRRVCGATYGAFSYSPLCKGAAWGWGLTPGYTRGKKPIAKNPTNRAAHAGTARTTQYRSLADRSHTPDADQAPNDRIMAAEVRAGLTL